MEIRCPGKITLAKEGLSQIVPRRERIWVLLPQESRSRFEHRALEIRCPGEIALGKEGQSQIALRRERIWVLLSQEQSELVGTAL